MANSLPGWSFKGDLIEKEAIVKNYQKNIRNDFAGFRPRLTQLSLKCASKWLSELSEWFPRKALNLKWDTACTDMSPVCTRLWCIKCSLHLKMDIVQDIQPDVKERKRKLAGHKNCERKRPHLLTLGWTCPGWLHTQPGAGSPGPSQNPAVRQHGSPPVGTDQECVKTCFCVSAGACEETLLLCFAEKLTNKAS